MVILLALAGVPIGAAAVGANELEELRKEVRSLRQVLDAQQRTIDTLTERLESLPATAPEQTAADDTGDAESSAETAVVRAIVASVAEDIATSTQVDLYGTLSYQDFGGEKSKFDARNIELLLSSAPHPRVRLGAEIEFEGTAQTSEGPRQGEVEVEQGWMELGLHRLANLRGGVILVPFGAYNLDHFDSSREFVDRPIMARRIVPTTWSEAGVGLTGSWHGWERAEIDYQAYLINGLTDRLSDTSPRGSRGAFRADNNDNKAIVGRAAFTYLGEQRLGLSGYYGAYSTTGSSQAGVDVDWRLTSGPFELQGEYAYFSLETGLTDAGVAAPGWRQGVYAQVNYRFWPQVLRETWLGRSFPESLLTAGLRWGLGEIADDDDTGGGNNVERRLSLGLNYRPLPTFVLKAEYQFNDARRESLEHGNANGFLMGLSAAF